MNLIIANEDQMGKKAFVCLSFERLTLGQF